jgi:GAF domain-containing protein
MSLPEGTLRLAAQSLRDLLRHLDPADSDSDEARQCVMLACEQILGGNGDAAGDGRHSAAMTPAAALAEAADKIRRAGTSLSVRRTAVDAAARICEAATAVWWDQQDPSSLALAAARGPKLPTEARAFTLTPSFWKSAAAREGVVTLSPDVEEHRGLLAAVNASRGVVVRAGVGARTVGVLGVFSGVYDDDRVDLLLALAQHAAVASHALTLGAEQRQLAEVQQRLVSELGFALSSALSLEELLDLICRSAIELLGADGSIVYLAGPENEFHLRAASSRELISSVGATLDQFAQQTRAQPLGRPLWRTSARGIGGLAHRSILGLVLSVRGDPLGALILLSKRPSAFSQAQREIMISFAAQAAVAVENIQLIEDMQRRLLEMADLTWVSTRITSTMEIERIAATVADAAGKALDAPRTALFVVNEAGEYVPVSHGQRGLNGEPREPLPSAGHLGHEALAMGVPQVVSDALREERADDPLVRWLGVRSLLCVPMVAQQGLRGILVIGDEKARDFPSHAVALLSAYANQTALALQSAMLYQDVVRHLKQLENLFGVSQTLASSLELTQTLDRVLNAAADLVDAPVGTLRLVDPDTEELIIKAARGIRPDHEFYRPLKLGEGLAGKAAQSASPLVSVDISRDGRFTHRDHAREGGLQAAIAAPLITRGRTLGVINLYRRSARPFGDDDTQLVMAFANSAAVAIENARLYEETQERAQFLTAMVSEINHRVRNTLQAVAGLLRMEMDQQPPRSIREVLRRGIARLQSVAVVHDMLQTRDLRFVDIKHAARRIVQLTCQAAAPGADVETKVSGARVMLPSQQATNVAMILSELVDNACRHGLPGTADARILVSLAEGGGNVVIEVKDNGKGLPGNFDLERNSGLGFRLVRGLVEEELGGSLDVQTDNGLTVRAKFPKRL